jgi:predicted nucleic acid-binding protein
LSIRIRNRVSDRASGVLDTSVVIDLLTIEPRKLPRESSIATISMAELGAGLHVTRDPAERAMRQALLQYVEGTLEAIPFDAQAARSYGLVYAAMFAVGRKTRGGRAVDLLIAATALSRGLALFTRNPSDFAGLSDLMDIVAV